ncbi:MAG: ABC transporter permease, partial [Gammaproteobacteria bacterium]|nr:ABC transporter permease [Gammaproteobacteria bacterium]
MLNPVELFIGLRYLRAKRRTRFVSFITLISLLGISLGVAALIVILSVMNGFEGELRNRLLSMSAHGSVSAADGTVEAWPALVARVASEPGVAAAAPFIQMEGMIQSGRDLVGVVVHGVEPAYERALSGDMINMVEGSLDVLRPGERSIVLGRMLAYDLGARIGDAVVLLVPKPVGDGTLQPVLQRFITRGVFEAGLQDHDAVLALVNIEDVADILDLGPAVESVRFRAEDVMAAPAIAASLQADLGDDYRSSDWTIENGSYFRAIRLEKMMMSLILSLIIGVAAFNIVAS